MRCSLPFAVRRDVGDRGLSTVEVVILAPVMILFILVLVAFGQLVDGRGALDGAARDAARAGSIQKDHATAMAEARAAAEADLEDVCSGPMKTPSTPSTSQIAGRLRSAVTVSAWTSRQTSSSATCR